VGPGRSRGSFVSGEVEAHGGGTKTRKVLVGRTGSVRWSMEMSIRGEYSHARKDTIHSSNILDKKKIKFGGSFELH